MSLPDPVHHHPAQQRLVGRGQPQRQSLAPLRHEQDVFRLIDRRTRIQNGRKRGLHLAPFVLEIAADQYVRLRNRFRMRQHVRGREVIRQPRIEFAQSAASSPRGRPMAAGAVPGVSHPASAAVLRRFEPPSGQRPRARAARHLLHRFRLRNQRHRSRISQDVELADERNLALFTARKERREAVIILLLDRDRIYDRGSARSR